nr:NAD-dependent epimerase/dehydratase family protein [Planosporangium flavigriseum]
MVTGAAGFIGSHLVDALLIRGFQVVALDRRNDTDNLADARRYRQFTFAHADLTRDDPGEWVAGCDTVFHFAAPPEDALTDHLTATSRLLDACEAAGVRRFVYASCASVYGTPGPNRETDPLAPTTAHGQAIQISEQLCLCRGIPTGATMSVAALRYGEVYGPRQHPTALIPRIMRAARTKTPIDLYGDAGHRQPLYVSDAVRAALAAATVEVREAAVNVAGSHTVDLDELVAIVRTVTGLPVPVSGDHQRSDHAGTTVDLFNACFLLGFRPRISLPDGLRRYGMVTADPAKRNASRRRRNAPRWG